jgi:outer membrane protein OmpA-like peptidoglycan-associated protein
MGTFCQQSAINKAKKLYQNKEYDQSIKYFEKAVKKGADSVLVAKNVLDAYKNLPMKQGSLNWFDFSIRKNSLSKDHYIDYARILVETREFDGAIRLLTDYGNKWNDYGWLNLLKNELKDLQSTPFYENFNLQNLKINNSSSLFSTFVFEDKKKVLFVSNDYSSGLINKRNELNNEGFFKLFIGTLNSFGEIVKVKRVKGIKSKYDIGNACIDSKSSIIYFASSNLNRSNLKDMKDIVRTRLYKAKWTGKRVKDITELPFNLLGSSCSHPCLSDDGNTLYFASDRPGGFGGSDIYKVSLKDENSLNKVVNLGKDVNTPGDEYFPFIHPTDKLFYFSSNGHVGFGGLDCYVARIDNKDQVRFVENLGSSLNSSSDDFALVVNEDQQGGYVSSNKVSGKGNDDLYLFSQQKKYKPIQYISGTVSNELNNNGLKGVLVALKDANGTTLDSTLTDENGNYTFSIANNDDLNEVFYSLQNYKQKTSEINPTKFVDNSLDLNVNLKPDNGYFFVGKIQDMSTKTNLKNVRIEVIDKKNKITHYYLNNADGTFATDTLEKHVYGDKANVMLRFTKDGYVSNVYSFTDMLDGKKDISINSGFPIFLNKIETGKTNLNDLIQINPILFDYSNFNIRPDAALELDKVVKLMQENPSIVVELRAHTDSRGGASQNLKLSQKRADAAVGYIKSKGISANRIIAKGYGETQPKVSDTIIYQKKSIDEQEKLLEINRRIDFIITKTIK